MRPRIPQSRSIYSLKRLKPYLAALWVILFLSFASLSFCLGQIEDPCAEESGGCSLLDILGEGLDVHTDSTVQIRREPENGRVFLYLFYGDDCRHCQELRAFLNTLVDSDAYEEFEGYTVNRALYDQYQSVDPRLLMNAYEISRDAANASILESFFAAYDTRFTGIPILFVGREAFSGFDRTTMPDEILRAIITAYGVAPVSSDNTITLPLFGKIDRSSPLFFLTILIGLLDGFNPCAFWVLMFLLSLLSTAKSRKRMLLIGSVFVISSGVVYFGFMSAWFNFFSLIGMHRIITWILSVVAIGMGLINLKEVFFFKKGVSLMISEKQKPKLYQRVRKIIQTRSTLLAIALTVALALFVNLIELTCTMGLPALFSKILTERKIAIGAKYFYLVLYNIAYIFPLWLIVVGFSVTLGKYKMTEKSAKVFKAISGLLMIALGIWLWFA